MGEERGIPGKGDRVSRLGGDGMTRMGGDDKELGETSRWGARGGWRGVDGDLGKMGGRAAT